jgi:REP element-mobilizing transposase RayT
MAHTHTLLVYHIVFGVRGRVPLLTNALREDVFQYIAGIVRNLDGYLYIVNGTPDHAHILARLGASTPVADLVRVLKANSSKWIRESGRSPDFAWQEGYGAFTVSRSQIARVGLYIERQQAHHRVRSFQEEYVELMSKHGVEYDPRFLWD